MSDQLYSAEEAAQILGLQVRTVRNYVRDGRLAGVRIGKQYRIARSALEAFAGSGPGGTDAIVPGASPSLGVQGQLRSVEQPVVSASSVVEVDPIGRAGAERIERVLAAATATAREGGPQVHVQPLYDGDRARLKVILVGSATQTAELLRVIAALTDEGSDRAMLD